MHAVYNDEALCNGHVELHSSLMLRSNWCVLLNMHAWLQVSASDNSCIKTVVDARVFLFVLKSENRICVCEVFAYF